MSWGKGYATMKLATLFREENILIHMQCGTMEDAARQLLQTLSADLGALDLEKVLQRLMQVEMALPVSLGYGVRMPHARLAGLDRLLLAMGTSQEGIPTQTNQDERANLIFLILAPKTQSTELLQTMASLSRLVHNAEDRKALVSTTSAARALRILEESGIEIKKAIVAADLMNHAEYAVLPNMTLRQATEALVASHEDGVPVISAGGEFLGDITSRTLVEIGLPKYMNLITNPRILSDFQPFEAFYKKEDTLTVEEVMNRNVLILSPDTPVEIVAHELLTKHVDRSYVVKEKKLLGVVYRKDIVRKVLYL